MKRALLLIALAACGRRGAAEQQLVEIKRADLVIGVAVTGELAAIDSTDIKPPSVNMWNFKIAAMADDGAEVKAGEPVVGFDPSEQMRELESVMNEVEAAKRNVDKKLADMALAKREQELELAQAEALVRKATLKTDTPGDIIASVDLEVLKLEEKSARIGLELAKAKASQTQRADAAALQTLKEKLAYVSFRAQQLQGDVMKMNVAAPRAGTVVYPVSWRGEKKKVGDGAWRMEVVLQIVGLDKMVGKGNVDEVDIAHVKGGQPVALQLDALPDVVLRGKVGPIAGRVHNKSQTDPSHVVGVKIDLDPTTSPLRPGMRFRGEVEAERIPNVVQIPSDAVFVTPDGPVAYREKDGELEAVQLQLGRRSATVIEVVSGLAPGDRVSRTDPTRRGSS